MADSTTSTFDNSSKDNIGQIGPVGEIVGGMLFASNNSFDNKRSLGMDDPALTGDLIHS